MTFRRQYPNADVAKLHLKDELGPEMMSRDEPPDHEFTLLLQPWLIGYNMQDKQWSKIDTLKFVYHIILTQYWQRHCLLRTYSQFYGTKTHFTRSLSTTR